MSWMVERPHGATSREVGRSGRKAGRAEEENFFPPECRRLGPGILERVVSPQAGLPTFKHLNHVGG